MVSQNKFDQFFEQVKGKPITAAVIINAIKAAGYAPELEPFFLAYAKANGVDIKTELADLTHAQEADRQDKAVQETAASLAEKSGELASESDPEKRKELIGGIQRIYETLKTTVTAVQKIITSKALMRKDFPARKWVVENLIGPGLTIFSGASKIGKSWLLFALAESASIGGKLLDHYTVNKTSVLHLSLEDTEQSIKERREILAQKQGGFSGNDDLLIATEWKSGHGGLEIYLKAHNEIKFVIIDTLGQFMPEFEDMSEYAPAVKALSGIKKIADSLGIAILVVHHAKKGSSKEKSGDWMDQSLGSQGIVGSADTIILLQRDIDKNGERLNTGKLYATGRSIKDISHKVEFFPSFGMWGITDNKLKAENKQDGPDKQSGNTEGRNNTSNAPGNLLGR